MCDYDPECSKPADEPAAVALSRSPREDDAVLLIICPTRHHLLAAVYDWPERGRVLCSPHFKFRHGSMFINPKDPRAVGHFHAALESLNAFSDEEIAYGRCRCGTWSYRPAHISKWLAPWEPGQQEWRKAAGLPPVGHEELVKVRHPNGQVSNMGKEVAEAQGMLIVGSVNRKRTRRPYMLANYVETADHT